MPLNVEAVQLGATQVIASAATSITSASAFGAGVKLVRVATTAAVNIRIGTAPITAVTTDTLLPANTVGFFIVQGGQSIASIGSGTVQITECG